MKEQFGLFNLMVLVLVAAATIVVHTKLKRSGHLVWAILSSLAGLGLMLYLLM